ncbi:hypothetical protein C0J52_16260 [Blattella germanica]|nr:hypothetical protein C0J52_16260 [Blattella germanica]
MLHLDQQRLIKWRLVCFFIAKRALRNAIVFLRLTVQELQARADTRERRQITSRLIHAVLLMKACFTLGVKKQFSTTTCGPVAGRVSLSNSWAPISFLEREGLRAK